MRNFIAVVLLTVALAVPASVHALVYFGGRMGQPRPCDTFGTFVVEVITWLGPRQISYSTTPASGPYYLMTGRPVHAGQFALGGKLVPYVCDIDIGSGFSGLNSWFITPTPGVGTSL